MKNLKKYIKAIIVHLRIIKSLFTEPIDENELEAMIEADIISQDVLGD